VIPSCRPTVRRKLIGGRPGSGKRLRFAPDRRNLPGIAILARISEAARLQLHLDTHWSLDEPLNVRICRVEGGYARPDLPRRPVFRY
jgi:hypothetical protein